MTSDLKHKVWFFNFFFLCHIQTNQNNIPNQKNKKETDKKNKHLKCSNVKKKNKEKEKRKKEKRQASNIIV